MNKVLIVDNNEQNRGACQVALEDYFELEFATNGKEGLEKTRTFDPDVILLDIIMPVMNGCEMLRQLKNDPKLAYIPVFIFTVGTNVRGKIWGKPSLLKDRLFISLEHERADYEQGTNS